MEETNKLVYGSIPRVLNEDILSFFCLKHKDEISIGSYKNFPRPRIRYVIDKNRFGYANFGDFFFWDDGGLYVWQQSDEFEEDHNPDIVEDYFGHPCEGRGYTLCSIFAGIDTGYDDSNGSRMFTGDIVLVKERNGYEMGALCLASPCGMISDGFYGFPLDNHSLTLDMCKEGGYHLERIGTIFYQLDPCEDPVSIWDKALTFNNTYRDKEDESVLRTMAKYTPNFDKEVWKYLGLEILGIEEFDWK